jgi:hypothetical protein
MARISNTPLTNKEHQLLVRQFVTLLSGKQSLKIEALITDVMTPTEQLILIKRVAAIILLDQGTSTYEVARTLKLSTATTCLYRNALQEGRWSKLLEEVRGKQFDSEKFWKTVDKVLRLGLPPVAGPGRWSSVAPAPVRSTRSRR